MKKIILIIIVMFSTGCYDYKELNNLAIISGIAIDYKDNNYIINLEILNDNTKDEKSYYIEGIGNTIKKAFDDANNKINHIPFYSHIKVLILGYNINYKDVIDYIIDKPSINNDFYVCISSNAKDIIRNKTNQEKIVSENIYYLLDRKNDKMTFEKFINDYLENKKIKLPKLKIENNNIEVNNDN